MKGSIYRFTRNVHLYVGLFFSPFVLVFAFSVFALVHSWLPGKEPGRPVTVSNLPLPPNLQGLSGRALIDAIRPALDKANVHGEVGWVEHRVRQGQLVIPVTVPGRLSTVTIDMAKREASIDPQTTGLMDALVVLHKAPGPHLVDIRMNWFYMRVWRWFADGAVYGLILVTASGLYLWQVLRAERTAGLILLGAGTISFFGLIYAICH